MATNLTGDFDVVAEFAIAAANRVLAAMHRFERFPHSLAIRVDDNPPPGSIVVGPSIVASVDEFGETIADQQHIGTPNPWPGQLASTDAIYSALDGIVNLDVTTATTGAFVPSHLQGRAQLQLFPPTIEVADASGNSVTVHLQLMARYFPDPHTSPAAEFVRGDLRITAAVSQVVSQAANVIEIDVKANNVNVSFIPTWSSRPLSAEDLAGISLLIHNALKTSVLPSNSPLPSNIRYIQFKTLFGGQHAVAVLLNMGGSRGNPASMNDVFLASGDDFALGVGADFVRSAFQPTIDKILSTPIPRYSFDVDFVFYTDHVHYDFSLHSVTLDLQAGQIVLTIKGHAHSDSTGFPSFDFTVNQAFTLQAHGATADLVVGATSLDTSSTVVNIVDWFSSAGLDRMRAAVDHALNNSDAQNTVRQQLNVNDKLGGFLQSLLSPVHPKPIHHPQPPASHLAYTSVEIRPSGIVLHGSLSVNSWPVPHVEFERIATHPVGPTDPVFGSGPDYSALKSWIPGGVVDRYDWSSQGQSQPFHTDTNTFVLIHPPPEVSDGTPSTSTVQGYVPLCLTVRGSRLASSGPAVAQPVAATVCGYSTFPVVNGGELGLTDDLPLVALVEPDPRGLLQIAGHTSVRVDGTSATTPNLIVHFADAKTADHLGRLTAALRESKREDAATAVLAVLTAEHLANARYIAGVIYSEDQGGAWERVFGLKTVVRPLTLIVGPKSDVRWQHEGDVDSHILAAALRKFLGAAKPVSISMLRASARIGRLPPNFLFEYAAGHELTLRKLAGRPAILVFWKSTSTPSIDAVRNVQATAAQADGRGAVVLAINDGEAPEVVKRIVAEHKLTATIVTDGERKISVAYGVNVWPTIVMIDAQGLIRAIRYGRLSGEAVAAGIEQQPASRG